MTGWRLRDAVGEAWRSVTAAVWRTVMLMLVMAGMVGALAWSELATTDHVLAFQRGFDDRGGWVVVASATRGDLPADRCVSIASQRGVVSAGAMTPGPTVQTAAAPGTLFQSASATVGAIQQWAASAPSSADLADGIVVGSAAANELGLAPGMIVTVDVVGGDQRVAAVIDTEDRNPFVARWLIQVAPPVGAANQCWVEFEPGTVPAGLGVMEAVFADLRPNLEVRRWIRLDDFSRDPVAELANRPQRQAWIPIGIAAAVLVWVIVWARTAEIGLYRAVGTRTSTLWLFGQFEAVFVLVPAAAAGYLWAVAAHAATADRQPGLDQLLIAARTSLSATLLALIVAPLAWAWSGRGQIAAQLKDR
ncbi:MAG: hypothetical protein WEA29_07105 [Acidimicrobiia bacterium]